MIHVFNSHIYSLFQDLPPGKKIAKEKRIILHYSLAKVAKKRQSVTACVAAEKETMQRKQTVETFIDVHKAFT